MKNNLRMLGLALCMLPMWLHAGTGEDLKQTDQGAEPIPAGTILPVTLNSALRSDKSASGATMTLTLMQDIPLGAGKILREGSEVTGHVVETTTPGRGSDESRISFQLDHIRLGNQTLPITTTLRAVASRSEVSAATPQLISSEYADNTIEIGGDQISYGEGGPVMVGAQVVGKYTRQGVLANVDQDLATPCRVTIDRNAQPQAFWVFSVNACGAYGFGDLRILRSGRTESPGEVTLASNRKAVKLDKGSAMLLRVDGSGSEEARVRTTPSREIGQ